MFVYGACSFYVCCSNASYINISAGKEGKCSTFGFPMDETNRQNWLRNIPKHLIKLLGIHVFV